MNGRFSPLTAPLPFLPLRAPLVFFQLFRSSEFLALSAPFSAPPRLRSNALLVYTGWLKLKYPSSKFAISWQQHKSLRPILQHLLSTNQRINPQNYAYISVKRQIYSIAKVKASTIFKFYRLTWIAANCPEFISKDEWPPNSPDLNTHVRQIFLSYK